MRVIRSAVARAELTALAAAQFDSMINVRPAHGNPTRDVADERVRDDIRRVVSALVRE